MKWTRNSQEATPTNLTHLLTEREEESIWIEVCKILVRTSSSMPTNTLAVQKDNPRTFFPTGSLKSLSPQVGGHVSTALLHAFQNRPGINVVRWNNCADKWNPSTQYFSHKYEIIKTETKTVKTEKFHNEINSEPTVHQLVASYVINMFHGNFSSCKACEASFCVN